MDCVNPNVLYYIQCRDRLNEPCAKILNECRQLFGDYAPKSTKSIRNLIQFKQITKKSIDKRQEIESNLVDDLKEECLDIQNDIESIQFKIDSLCGIPKKLLFYICCRYQLKESLKSILDELNVLYPQYQVNEANLDQAVSNCFQLDNKITQGSNINQTQISVKTGVIEQTGETISIDYSTSLTTYNLQEQIELADLENVKLNSIINKLDDEKIRLINELDKLLTEYDLYKLKNKRELFKLNHNIQCLQDANKREAENNLELNSKLTKFSHEINEAVSEISRLNDHLNELKEKNKKLEEERDKLLQEKIGFDTNLKSLMERDHMHLESIDKAKGYLKQLKKENEDLKKENQELKMSSSRFEYLKHLNETSKIVKELKEKSYQIECLNKQNETLNKKLNQTSNELTAKTNAWLDQANTIKTMEIQILNLKAVNIDLETRLNSNYYNIYASNYYQSTNYNNVIEKGKNRRIRPVHSNENNQGVNHSNSSKQLIESTEKIQKLMDIKIPDDAMEIENSDEKS